jgi:hypothetical protein
MEQRNESKPHMLKYINLYFDRQKKRKDALVKYRKLFLNRHIKKKDCAFYLVLFLYIKNLISCNIYSRLFLKSIK